MDTNYQANSHKSKSEQKLAPVAKGKIKEAPTQRRFLNALFAEDVQDIKSYILWDMILPAVRDGFRTVLIGTVEAIFGRGKSKNGYSNASYVSYNQVTTGRETRASVTQSWDRYNNLIFANRGEAEEVLETMRDLLDRYGLVRVADLFDLAGIQGEYTDNRYGWTNLSRARVDHDIDGWRLALPRPIVIN